MTVGLVAIHYPHAQFHDEFRGRVQLAADLMRDRPGCKTADCWVTAAGDAIVSVGYWVSEEAQVAGFAFATANGVDFSYDERELSPRVILRLVTG
ncbi:hypothetical protein BA895_22330 [Humibacillus sp. DSM 29435]|uniref:hypothetical protein n=1 Tax=Humibacillus sp. DSM 29435 TaxID=1869167 RepID=UPI00087309B4|nr:hypothetical protein [Humibacillus sp. DSM 29435]OFE15594.1 hypothetical protein BA895_22330 [Humibacillus sp. DSM 29435]